MLLFNMKRAWEMVKNMGNLKTSYVIVQQTALSDAVWDKEDLKTSYVIVQHRILLPSFFRQAYLKTSYVIVQPTPTFTEGEDIVI